MSKSDSSNPNGGPSFQGPRYRPNWLAATICFISGTYLSAALIDYNPNQTLFNTTSPGSKNWVGWLGADSVWVLFYAIGISTWLLPLALYWMFYIAIRNSRHLVATRVTAVVIGVVSMSGLLAMFESVKPNDTFPNAWGGWIGHTIYHRILSDALGPFGSGLFLGAVYCFALLFVITRDIGAEIERIIGNFTEWRAERARRKVALAEELAKSKEDRAKQKSAIIPALPPLPPQPVGPSGSRKIVVPRGPEDPLGRSLTRPAFAVAEPAPKVEAKAPATAGPPPKIALTIVKPEEPKKAKVVLPQTFDESYEFPPVKLLKEQVKPAGENSDEEHRHNAETLLRILGEFG